MKKLLLLSAALSLGLAVHSQTPVSGDISGTWTLAGSPYEIEGFTTVPDDNTLTIEAGVEVVWQGSYAMDIQGRILALGTESDSILFTAADPDVGFKGIRFNSTASDNGTSKFEYCIFEYGKAHGDSLENSGGALAAIDFSDIIIDHCLFRNNEALDNTVWPYAWGGAIGLANSSPEILNSTFTDNKSLAGGAIVCYKYSSPSIKYAKFINNTALSASYEGTGYGGAIFCFDSCSPAISENTFNGNLAHIGGGALAFVNKCYPPMIDHNLICHNTAWYWGGGIELQDSCTALIRNNTIADNLSPGMFGEGYGGGIRINLGSTASIVNTILWGNTANMEGDQLYVSYGCIADIDYSDLEGGETAIGGNGDVNYTEDCIDQDPLFEESDTCFYYLTVFSPCIDACNPFCTDPDGTICDMGAFYYKLHDGISQFQVPGYGLRFEVYPNPAGEILHVQYSVYDAQYISLKIFNVVGIEVRTIVDGMEPEGEYQVQVDVSDIPPGIYLVRLFSGGENVSVKLMVY